MELFSSPISIRNNKHLMNIVFSYLNLKDSLSSSLVCKKWNLIIEEQFNTQWRTECINYFSINSRRIQLTYAVDWFQSNSITNHLFDDNQNQYYHHQLDFIWKKLFVSELKIKAKWSDYIARCSAGPIKDDFRILSDELYCYLKECLDNPKLRKDNCHLENNLNTQFQYCLYDYLEEEEELYTKYHDIMGTKITTNEEITNYPFSLLIEYCNHLVQNLQKNTRQLEKFTELRWYLFDSNYNVEKMQKDLNGCLTDNVIIFALKIIILTLKHHCFLSFNYLNSDDMKGEELLNEYSIRYTNYIQTAIEVNDKYRHLSIVVNYIYEKTKSKYNEPRFSLLRLFMIVWNNCCLDKLKTKLTQSITTVFGDVIQNDLDTLFNTSEISLNSMRTTCSSKDSIPSTSMCYYNTNYNKEHQFANELKKNIISRVISQLNDSFCNEYSVFEVNLTTIKTNDIYDALESTLIETLRKEIISCYNSNIALKIKPITIVNQLLKYFTESTFFQECFINKLQMKFNETVYQTLEAILGKEVNRIFQNEFIQTIKAKFSLETVNVFLEHYENEYKESVLYKKLLKKMNRSIHDKIKEYLLILFFQYYSKENKNMYSLSKEITYWYTDRQKSKMKTDKKVNKEIRDRNIRSDISLLESRILSFAWKPCKADIIAYEEECKQRSNNCRFSSTSDSMIID